MDASLPIAKAVGAANEAMGIDAGGTLVQQVEELMSQLGIVAGAAAPPAPVRRRLRPWLRRRRRRLLSCRRLLSQGC